MKVVVRGDRNTGKSCLLYRMQGKTFSESYIPTNEIQVGHILWTYPGELNRLKETVFINCFVRAYIWEQDVIHFIHVLVVHWQVYTCMLY